MADNLIMVAKAMGGSAALLAASSLPGINQVTLPFAGVPLTAVTMSAAGAVCSFAWQSGDISRAKLFAVVTASAIVGATIVGVLPWIFERELKAEFQPPLAFLCGLIAPWAVPAAKAAIPAFFSGLANMLVKMVGGKAEAAAKEYTAKVYTPDPKAQPKDDDGED